MRLSAAQVDRACGVLLASAAGDALGAGYEFGSAPYDGTPAMIGGGLGGFTPGEWTDDTAQAVAIARVAATGADLRTDDALSAVARGFAEWYADGPTDVGIQTSQVLSLAGPEPTAESMTEAARRVHERTGRSAGNGALMRTGPVAIAHLDDPDALVEAAKAVSALTHHDPMAGEAAALWCLMIRHAVLTGELPTAADVAPLLREATRDWAAVLTEAESRSPSSFVQNGWVVGALQAAWSAIVHTPVPEVMPCRHLQHALATGIGIGHDTDTVAAIAGALLGARWGASAVPLEWVGMLHGWGASSGQALVELATTTVAPRPGHWPDVDRMDYSTYDCHRAYAPHPTVGGVWIGGATALDDLPDAIDAVVSLCRVGRKQVDGRKHVAVRIIDTDPADNPNLDWVIDDAARTVLRLRDEGRHVYLHCAAAQSRTPTVAARVAVLGGTRLDESLASVARVLPAAAPRTFFVESLERLSRHRG